MASILYVAHTDPDGSLPKPACESLEAARQLKNALGDATLTVGLIGDQVQDAADAIASCGADQFMAVTGNEFAVSRYGSDLLAITELVRKSEATLVLAPATCRLTRVLPGVAQRCDGCIDTQVTEISVADGGQVQIQRWYYRQRMVATLSREQRPWFLSLAAGVYDSWQGTSGKAQVTQLEVQLEEGATRTRPLGTKAADADTQTIRPDADLLLVAGAGWTKKQSDGETHVPEAEKILLDFLDQTQASLGSSKSLVDQDAEGQQVISFLSHLNQVGQTGSTPRHPKGLATCCHGEEPHVVGWRFINQRRAINADPNCSWAQGKADVLYVADAFEVMKKVNELLG
jgi:electron transfer flavoprotein alpha subunit